MPGETPDPRILLPGAGLGSLPHPNVAFLYFDRVFVQCQTWLLCLLRIFVFSNDVCMIPLATLPMPGASSWTPRPSLPRHEAGVPTLAPAPLPRPGVQLQQEMREKPQQKGGFSKERKYMIFSSVTPSFKSSLASDAQSCDGNHPSLAL